MRALFEHGVDFLACFLAQVVMCNVQDILKEEAITDEQWAEIGSMLTLAESTVRMVDVETLGLAYVKATSTELGSLLGKIVLESLLPLLAGGEALAGKARSFCNVVLTAVAKKTYKCAILYAAVGEVKKMVDCVLMLADKASTLDLDVIEKVFGSRTGNKFLSRQALQQNGWYRAQEAHVRTTYSASKMLIPEMQKTKQALQEEASQSRIEEAVMQLPAWRNSLRPGLTLDLEAELTSYAEEVQGSRGCRQGRRPEELSLLRRDTGQLCYHPRVATEPCVQCSFQAHCYPGSRSHYNMREAASGASPS